MTHFLFNAALTVALAWPALFVILALVPITLWIQVCLVQLETLHLTLPYLLETLRLTPGTLHLTPGTLHPTPHKLFCRDTV
jgi:hypothetical protein